MSDIPVKTPAGRPKVVVLDANPILGEAMCRQVAAGADFDRRDVLALGWGALDELALAGASILIFDPAEAPGGLEAFVAATRARSPDLRLVAYASNATVALSRACMVLGFRAFLARDADGAQVSAAIAAVAGGGLYVDRRFAASLLAAVDAPQAADADPLSAREAAVLRALALGASHKQIGQELGLSHKTVDTYRARGMRKLGLADRGDLVRLAVERDWIA